ncbi:MAG TPA: ABC transporter permease [Mycobacteriales bacterium]|nr:ABC transporter permease [Mycobacteriales bacterium]
MMGRVVRAGVGRRRVQTLVMVLTALLAVAASVLAVGLLVASDAPFDHAFADQKGAHLTAEFDGAKVTTAQLAGTAHTSGVTATAGPFPILSARPHNTSGPDGDAPMPTATIAGRSDPDGPVDQVDLLSGSWPTAQGQIVLSADYAPVPVGAKLRFPDLPGDPTLTVVGTASSITGTADAWVTPAQLTAMVPAGAAPTYQMLYRFDRSATAAQISADQSAVAAGLPTGAMTGTQSYLIAKQDADGNAKAFVPFVAAFGILGLVLSVLIIAIVVSGAVGAATRRIGILKSLGFTPAQVAWAYVAQALVPAAVGVVLGAVVGNVLAVPVLHDVEVGYGGASASIPLWVDVTVPVAALVLVAAAALVPALRAGRLRAAEAIALGRTPKVTRGRTARRLLGRLPLPRPVSLGLAGPFARPGRSATMAAAVLVGAVAVTFAVGLTESLGAVQQGRALDTAGAVRVETGNGLAAPGTVPGPGQRSNRPADPRAVAAAIAKEPGTRAYYSTARVDLAVSGLSGTSPVIAYDGDSSWGTHQMVSGHWLTGPGQAVVTKRFLDAAGVQVGDTVTLTANGHHSVVRIVGEAFFTDDQGMDLLTETGSLAGLGVDAKPDHFCVDLDPGTDVSGYLHSLNSALESQRAVAVANTSDRSSVIVSMDALVATLTLMLVVVAGLGVLNTVVLDTRDRVHDLGIFRALGMAPRQVIALVISSVAAIGLVAGIVGVPLGVVLHHNVVPLMGDSIRMTVPHTDIAVYDGPVLVLLALGGLVIAVAGALLPASWAAGTRTATALRAE